MVQESQTWILTTETGCKANASELHPPLVKPGQGRVDTKVSALVQGLAGMLTLISSEQ